MDEQKKAHAALLTQQKTLDDGRREYTRAAQTLETACQTQGIAHLAELRTLQMEEAEVKSLQALRETLNNSEIETNTRLRTKQNEQADIAEEAAPLPDPETPKATSSARPGPTSVASCSFFSALARIFSPSFLSPGACCSSSPRKSVTPKNSSCLASVS